MTFDGGPPLGGFCAPKRKTQPTPETKERRLQIAYLKRCGLPVRQVAVQKVGCAQFGKRPVYFGQKGMSDLRADLVGTPVQIYVEVKAPGRMEPCGKAEREHYAEQLAYLAAKRADGHVALMADSVFLIWAALVGAGFQVRNPWQCMRSMLYAAGLRPDPTGTVAA
ncbi:hypothetical protein [Geothrix campi]|uniref:hypothetical protein n=1 Tax=Geothrix campi TaxID=2966450 RepID=UPI0021488227|nr:hypothetical protein [Geothrix sp. SG10]